MRSVSAEMFPRENAFSNGFWDARVSRRCGDTAAVWNGVWKKNLQNVRTRVMCVVDRSSQRSVGEIERLGWRMHRGIRVHATGHQAEVCVRCYVAPYERKAQGSESEINCKCVRKSERKRGILRGWNTPETERPSGARKLNGKRIHWRGWGPPEETNDWRSKREEKTCRRKCLAAIKC